MIERHPCSIFWKIQLKSYVWGIFLDFGHTLINLLFFLAFMLFLLAEIDGFEYVHVGFLHAVCWCYSPYTAGESQVLLWISSATEIFGIRNHFSEHQKLLLLEWNGSSDIWFPFHSKYFRRIPAASPENFWKYIIVYWLLLWYIFLYKDIPYSLHFRSLNPLLHLNIGTPAFQFVAQQSDRIIFRNQTLQI